MIAFTPNPAEVTDDPAGQLLCPVCDSPYVHLGGVNINQNGHVVTIGNGTASIDHDGPPSGRGSQVMVGFWCEGGHCFSQTIAFHKGETFTGLQVGSDIDAATAPELWRD